MKCPKCDSEEIIVGFGIHPDYPTQPARDLGLCRKCNYMGEWKEFEE